MFEVRSHQLLVTEEQKTRHEKARVQEVLQLVQGFDSSQRGEKVKAACRLLVAAVQCSRKGA